MKFLIGAFSLVGLWLLTKYRQQRREFKSLERYLHEIAQQVDDFILPGNVPSKDMSGKQVIIRAKKTPSGRSLHVALELQLQKPGVHAGSFNNSAVRLETEKGERLGSLTLLNPTQSTALRGETTVQTGLTGEVHFRFSAGFVNGKLLFAGPMF